MQRTPAAPTTGAMKCALSAVTRASPTAPASASRTTVERSLHSTEFHYLLKSLNTWLMHTQLHAYSNIHTSKGGLCREPAGHAGKHICDTPEHCCGRPCWLAGKALNCREKCRKMPGHAGSCDCMCGNHLCGAPCALPGCGRRCVAPYGSVHERHACAMTTCPHVRTLPDVARAHLVYSLLLWDAYVGSNSIAGPRLGCKTWRACMQTCPLCEYACPGTHFHGLEDPSATHLCGREHACVDPATKQQRKCGNKGACGITAELAKVETRTFRGKLQDFEYTALTRQVSY